MYLLVCIFPSSPGFPGASSPICRLANRKLPRHLTRRGIGRARGRSGRPTWESATIKCSPLRPCEINLTRRRHGQSRNRRIPDPHTQTALHPSPTHPLHGSPGRGGDSPPEHLPHPSLSDIRSIRASHRHPTHLHVCSTPPDPTQGELRGTRASLHHLRGPYPRTGCARGSRPDLRDPARGWMRVR